MLKELDQQTMEETNGGTFCLLGGIFKGVGGILTGIGGILGGGCTPAPAPTCPTPAPAPTCPAPTNPPCGGSTPRPSYHS